ncbi:uncharacterized protein BYT42DRAFT_544920 [Radiomyces spectabilis]|uniref:uncharacterized protein n=1 Tax=Radiomyces spectabilis TaxID=64574 RepID=UPI00221F3E2D|nr:uncharacterized protein BYT42DRAFT_544920 [Radiomyces spectabilis]KAI8380952.1 hypothetical protein BYT42DRAFT_544920 [Radiomyces spectabilis]
MSYSTHYSQEFYNSTLTGPASMSMYRHSTPVLAPRQHIKSTGPEIAPVIVPSMPPTFLENYYQRSHQVTEPRYPRMMTHLQPYYYPVSTNQPRPIHHTLENATITYDTFETRQKDLVKDVFFSPAFGSECDQDEVSSSSSSDTASSPREHGSGLFSPQVSPSDVLQEQDPLFYFGLDLDTSLLDEPFSTHHPCHFSLPSSSLALSPVAYQTDLPTPPATEDYIQLTGSLKRQPALAEGPAAKKYSRYMTPSLTPPASPFDHDDEDESDLDHPFDDQDDSEEEIEDQDRHGHYYPHALQDPVTDHFGFDEGSSGDESSSPAIDTQDIVTAGRGHQGWDGASDEEEEVEGENDDQDEDEEVDDSDLMEKVSPRPTAQPTIYQMLTMANVDWCRYCGTTEGVNWRPGPWGKRTLCNKHGCDYKGYGFACKLPRLDLTSFASESIEERDRPVLQLFCSACQRPESFAGNVLVRCEGCPKAYHQKCCPTGPLDDDLVASDTPWFCEMACRENARRKRIVVELPRKRLPLMCTPKPHTSSSYSDVTSRPRSSSR